MTTKTIKLTTLLFATCISSFASAATVYGPSGLILYPSAYVAPTKATGIGISTFAVKPAAGGTQQWMSTSGAVGLVGRAEVGVTYLRRSGGGTLNSFGGFGKYKLFGETVATPAVSIGADIIGGDLRTQQVYLVASKQVLPSATQHPLTLTAGGYFVDYRDGVKRSGQDIFGGAEFKLSKSLSLAGEWRSRTKFNLKDSSGAMLMWHAKRYGLGAGLVNNGNSRSHQFFIGAGFSVGSLD